MDNIIICRVFTHEEQMGATFHITTLFFSEFIGVLVDIVKPIAALLSDVNQGPFRLLIIDSIIGKRKKKL